MVRVLRTPPPTLCPSPTPPHTAPIDTTLPVPTSRAGQAGAVGQRHNPRSTGSRGRTFPQHQPPRPAPSRSPRTSPCSSFSAATTSCFSCAALGRAPPSGSSLRGSRAEGRLEGSAGGTGRDGRRGRGHAQADTQVVVPRRAPQHPPLEGGRRRLRSRHAPRHGGARPPLRRPRGANAVAMATRRAEATGRYRIIILKCFLTFI